MTYRAQCARKRELVARAKAMAALVCWRIMPSSSGEWPFVVDHVYEAFTPPSPAPDAEGEA